MIHEKKSYVVTCDGCGETPFLENSYTFLELIGHLRGESWIIYDDGHAAICGRCRKVLQRTMHLKGLTSDNIEATD